MVKVEMIMPLVIGLILAGVVLGVGVLVLQNFENIELTATETSRNITLLNGTAVTLTDLWITDIGAIVNASNTSQTVGTGNYTATTSTEGVAGSVTLTTSSPWNNSAVTVTYTYNLYNDAATDIDGTEEAVMSFASDWLPIIIIAAAAAIILFLLIGTIRKR